MYVIYGNIYHQYTPNVSIYTSTMDPMGFAGNPWQQMVRKYPWSMAPPMIYIVPSGNLT